MDTIFPEEMILLDIPIDSKDDIFYVLSEKLLQLHRIDSIDGFLKDVYDREAAGGTGIENGLAIPHGKSYAVQQTSIAFARLKTPIFWETLDGNPVDKIVLFAVSNSAKDRDIRYLSLLAKVSGNLTRHNTVELLGTSMDKEMIRGLLIN
ncbi:MAG: PTS sugar transporter subunit IIA [Brevinema sp.]